ncbi:MAG: hypothetical protein GY810_29525 [Aureispira sp.]|nr:hypothetical protein [Aureispira sp.]
MEQSDDLTQNIELNVYPIDTNWVIVYNPVQEELTIRITNKQGKQVVNATASKINQTQSTLVAQGTEVSLYFYNNEKKDSIYHPHILFEYNLEKNIVVLKKEETRISSVPFYNSQTQKEMITSQIEWKIDNDILLIDGVEQNNYTKKQQDFDQIRIKSVPQKNNK